MNNDAATGARAEGDTSHMTDFDLASGGRADADAEAEVQAAYLTLERHRKERRRRRIVRGAIAGAVVVLLVVLVAVRAMSAGQDSDAETTLPTAAVYKGDLSDSVSATGSAQPVSSAYVTSEVDGTVDSIEVSEGQQVAKGDLVLTIKNDQLDADVASAQIQVETAQASLDSAYANLNSAQRAASAEETADGSDTTSLQLAVRQAQLELQNAQASLTQAQDKAADREVCAPMAGTVLSLDAKVGQSASGVSSGSNQSSGALAQIADLSQLAVSIQVGENDISKISTDQAATVTFTAVPDVVCDATVTSIAASSSTASNGESGTTGVATYKVDLVIPEPDSRIKPGMSANVKIVCDSAQDVLIVPSTAVQKDEDGQSYVTVVTYDDQGQPAYKKVQVEVGVSSSTECAVSGDLKEGDQVLLGSADVLGVEGATADYVVQGSAEANSVDAEGEENAVAGTEANSEAASEEPSAGNSDGA